MKKYIFLILALLPLSTFAQLSYDWSSTRSYPVSFSWYTSTGIYFATSLWSTNWDSYNSSYCSSYAISLMGGTSQYPFSSCVNLWNDHFITYSFFNEFDLSDSLTGAILDIPYMQSSAGSFIYSETATGIVFDIFHTNWDILQHNYRSLPIASWTNWSRFLLASSITINNYYNSVTNSVELYLVRTSTDIYTLSWKTFSYKSDFLGTSAHWTLLNISPISWSFLLAWTDWWYPNIHFNSKPASIYTFWYVVNPVLLPIGITVFDVFRENDLVNWTDSVIDYQDDFFDPLPTDTWSTIWECDLKLDFVWFFGCTINWLYNSVVDWIKWLFNYFLPDISFSGQFDSCGSFSSGSTVSISQRFANIIAIINFIPPEDWTTICTIYWPQEIHYWALWPEENFFEKYIPWQVPQLEIDPHIAFGQTIVDIITIFAFILLIFYKRHD